METITSNETLSSNAKKADNSKWNFKQRIKALFRRKENIERIENGDSKQLVEHHPIKDTPFSAVKFEDKWFLTLGKYRLTNQLQSKKACEEEAKDASWIRIMQVIKIVIQEHEAEKELIKNLTKNN